MNEKIDAPTAKENRRKYGRFRSTAFNGLTIQLTPLPPYFGEHAEGQLIDLSAGGLAMLIKDRIPAKSKFHLEMTFPDHTHIVSDIKVCHAIRRKNGFFTGIEFINIPPYMIKKIEKMAEDFNNCEGRIVAQKKDVCDLKCAFFTLCDKPEKKGEVDKLEIPVHLKLTQIR